MKLLRITPSKKEAIVQKLAKALDENMGFNDLARLGKEEFILLKDSDIRDICVQVRSRSKTEEPATKKKQK